MRQFLRTIGFASICLFVGVPTLPADVHGLARLIDQRIDQRLAGENIQPGETISDHQFIRRLTLDLAGRIPTIAELDAFIGSRENDKRTRLVARLIDSPDFAFHQRNELDTLLLRRLQHNDPWREYLLEATTENRSWEQLFREIISPEDTLSEDNRPVAFLSQRINNIDAVTNDSSIVWFGVNVGCAKCHDHPLVLDWTQAHYYGMASFFKRTFRTRKGLLGERFDGNLKYTTIDGDDLQADFMFLTGAKVTEPESHLEEAQLKEYREAIKKAEKDDKADPPPKPDFRPRSQLVELALGDRQSMFFAKNIVNRIWARLMGRGLVHPLDQMHSENLPSHPQLLAELAGDMASHGYDLKRLVQAIVLSDTYARRSQNHSDDPLAADLFAVASHRPLSPHQLSLSYRVATSNPDQMVGYLDAENWPAKRAELEKQSEGQARQFEIPDDGFQVPISEALWFSNNASIQNDILGNSRQKLVGYLGGFDSDDEVSFRACKSILSRPPSGDQHQTITGYLAARADRREQAIRQVVWALMVSAEFRFNH